MSGLVLFEDAGFVDLLPLVFWRTVFELRVGRKLLLDRTAQRLGVAVSGVWTRGWIARVAQQRCGAPVNRPVGDGTILVNGRWLFDPPVEFPRPPCVGTVDGQVAYVVCDAKLASRLSSEVMLNESACEAVLADVDWYEASGRMIRYPWDILRDLPALLSNDWSQPDAVVESDLDRSFDQEQAGAIHIGERVRVHRTAILDTSAGFIFISHDVSVGPYAVLEGPLYVGPGTKIHPYTWLHGGNAVGPVCRLGGEIHGCVIHGYTNKAHDGFLGHSYVGNWVNIGAGATTSDLKNTYGTVRAPVNGEDVDTGSRFLGAIIADHAKVGINSGLASGTVFGFASVTATCGPVPKYVPSLSWITPSGMSSGDTDRLLDVAAVVMARRNTDMTDEEVELFLDLDNVVHEFEAKP